VYIYYLFERVMTDKVFWRAESDDDGRRRPYHYQHWIELDWFWTYK
jgi:hypothetical protein